LLSEPTPAEPLRSLPKTNAAFWVRPEIVAQIEFLEWTDGDHLRHSKFAGLRDDKDPRKVVREVQGPVYSFQPQESHLN
jgi:ATP-dependent DNA ligase